MTARSLVLAQGMDAASFAVAASLFPLLVSFERNPVIGALYAVGGVLAVVGAKVGMSLFGAYAIKRSRSRNLIALLLAFGVLSGVVGAGSNIATLAFVMQR